MWDFQGMLPVLAVFGSVGGFAIWLSSQMNAIKETIFGQIDKINTKIEKIEEALIEKMEYHERHDDKRFNDIRDSLWEIRLRNAAMEGVIAPAKKAEITLKKDIK